MKTNSVHLLLVTLLLSVAISTSAFSASIRIEAEDYVDSHDIAFDPIAKVPGSSCSGGYMLVGLDAQGEWTEYNLPVSDFGVYTVKMLCRGNLNWTYSLDLILTSGETGETQTIQVSFVGLGYG